MDYIEALPAPVKAEVLAVRQLIQKKRDTSVCSACDAPIIQKAVGDKDFSGKSYVCYPGSGVGIFPEYL